MSRLATRLMKGLMIVSLGLLPGLGIDCDLEDGELDIDLDGLNWHRQDDGYFGYYDEDFYDPFFIPCCW